MRHNGTGLLMAGIVAVLAFVAGYWPQHQKYLGALEELHASDQKMLAVQASQRIFYMENLMLQVLDLTAHQELKEAHKLASQFFLEVRANMARPDMAQYSNQLKAIAEKSDAIEAAIDKQDTASRDLLRDVMQELAQIAAPPPTVKEPPELLPTPAAPPN
jgi:hypothetical protein